MAFLRLLRVNRTKRSPRSPLPYPCQCCSVLTLKIAEPWAGSCSVRARGQTQDCFLIELAVDRRCSSRFVIPSQC